jgi:hypothetical protein
MLKKPQGMLSLAILSIVLMVVITTLQTIFRPALISLKAESISESAHDIKLKEPTTDQTNNMANPRTLSTWGNAYSSGKVITQPEGGLSSSWSGPYSSGHVIVNPDGSLSSSWSGPYSSGEVVIPRRPRD